MNVLRTDRNKNADPALFQFTSGIEVDRRLAPHEIGVQKAWVKVLAGGGYLSAEECRKALCFLDKALGQIEESSFEWRAEDEDIHMNLERFITDEAGDLGRKMHMGRSRNDLIATTLRLYTTCCAQSVSGAVCDLAGALCDLGESTVEVIVPGTTHMQHGQPVSFGQIASAHAAAFARDAGRLNAAAQTCIEYMPLGSAALSGTPLALDLKACAKELGFLSPPENSYDAVGDRDFMIETIDAFASVAVHIGRLAEDVIHWSSTAVGLVKLPKEYSTGSSIMPNKRNPDVAELARARASRVIAQAGEAHAILKSVPTSYGSDLHELKKCFVAAADEIKATLAAMTQFVRGLAVDEGRAAELLGRGHVLATEIADALTSQGMSFREAYGKTAALVELAESKGVQVHELSRGDANSIVPESDLGFFDSLSFESAVKKRNAPGGTSPNKVLDHILALRTKLSDLIS